MTIPSPSFPACSAAPPCRILVRTLSPSAGGCPAAALPIPPGLLPIPTGAALEPSNDKEHQHPTYFTRGHCVGYGNGGTETHRCLLEVV